MKDFGILADALDYIEKNLCTELSQADISAYCYCSLSQLQKLFRYVFHMSIGDYINRRRMTNAARDLLETDMNVLEIAMKYGFNSAEVFTRAFARLWKIPPTKFRREWSFSGIFPPLDFTIDDGGKIMSSKKFDISELYDYLKNRTNTYVISFDMVGLMPLNENYGHTAGDKAILECLKRIDTEADENMLTFRIGGDEFVLVTGLESKEAVCEIAGRILSHNGETVYDSGNIIPVSLRAGAVKIAGRNVRYNELFEKLVNISRPQNNDLCCYFAD